MTNRSDLDICLAQIELVKQLLGPETFDLKKILIELETKKKLLMMFKPRDYARILKGLESGVLKHPGDWVFEEKEIETPEPVIYNSPTPTYIEPEPEPVIIPEPEPIIKEDPKDAEIVKLKEQLEVLELKETLKELNKEEEAEIIPEVIE